MDSTCQIDGFGPLPVRRPASVNELCDIVREAAKNRTAVYPLGGQTMLDLGLPPSKQGLAVDLRGLDTVVDYPARDMTITVQAGITIDRLQSILQAEGQWLPVDVPLPERATLGGAIATNASGPRRFGNGTLRDYVIGISVVNDEGQEVKGGGRVVKNVAGYDLMKLFTGSMGTLGVISQVTLKVKPLPEASVLVAIPTTAHRVGELLDALSTTRTRPVCIELLSSDAATAARLTNQWLLVIGFEDNAKSVEWQQAELRKELPPDATQGLAVLLPFGGWQILRDLGHLVSSRFSFKANLKSSAVAAFCAAASALSPRPVLHAHAANGIVYGQVAADLTREQAAAMLTKLAPLAEAAHGNLIVTRCPSEWKRDLPVWGRSTGDRALMRAVKQQLDPRGIFNPGRFVVGI